MAEAAPLGTMIGTSAYPVMDGIYLAVVASALLLLLGAAGLFVLMNGDLDVMHHARTVGAGTK